MLLYGRRNRQPPSIDCARLIRDTARVADLHCIGRTLDVRPFLNAEEPIERAVATSPRRSSSRPRRRRLLNVGIDARASTPAEFRDRIASGQE
jgi:hypothetical protein